MGKVLAFPGVDLNPPSRNELVDEISDMMLKEVISVFIDQKMEPGCHANWYRAIRNYYWREPFILVDRDFREADLRRWRLHWREQAFRDIYNRRPR